jgi:hypothetical protein
VVIEKTNSGRDLGISGGPRVNVLGLNLALEGALPSQTPEKEPCAYHVVQVAGMLTGNELPEALSGEDFTQHGEYQIAVVNPDIHEQRTDLQTARTLLKDFSQPHRLQPRRLYPDRTAVDPEKTAR